MSIRIVSTNPPVYRCTGCGMQYVPYPEAMNKLGLVQHWANDHKQCVKAKP